MKLERHFMYTISLLFTNLVTQLISTGPFLKTILYTYFMSDVKVLNSRLNSTKIVVKNLIKLEKKYSRELFLVENRDI